MILATSPGPREWVTCQVGNSVAARRVAYRCSYTWPPPVHKATISSPWWHLLIDDLFELRVKGPRLVYSFARNNKATNLTHMVAICAIQSQFSKVLPYYGFEMDQILSLHQLVGDALVLVKQQLNATSGDGYIKQWLRPGLNPTRRNHTS